REAQSDHQCGERGRERYDIYNSIPACAPKAASVTDFDHLPQPHLQRSKVLACLINFRLNAVPQELAGGNMSPMRKTAGKKVAATRKRNAAKRQAAAKKAASTRKG